MYEWRRWCYTNKKYLEDSLELQDIDIVPLSMNNHKELLFKINELRKSYNILCTM